MKICSKCKLEKDEGEFNFSAKHRYKLQSYCQACQAKYCADYSLENKDSYKEATKRWRAENQDYSKIEAIRKAIISVIKRGGDKIHPKLGYSGNEIKNHFNIETYTRGLIDFIRSPLEFDISRDFKEAASFANLVIKK